MSRPASLKASFVIPVYNGQDTLAQTVQSCLNQTQRGIEVIIVNDGSTDHTHEIASYFAAKDKRVVYENLPENIGRSKARNHGMSKARADVIFVLDADDIALPDRVADTLNYMKKNPVVDVVYGKFHIIDDMGRILANADAYAFDIEKVKESGFTYIGHSTMAYKKSVLEKVQYTDGDFSRHAIDDWKFQVDCYKAGFRFGAIDRILSQWRASQKPRDEKAILELKKSCLH